MDVRGRQKAPGSYVYGRGDGCLQGGSIPPLDAAKRRVDHITTLLALLLEDPLCSITIGLVCKSYPADDAAYIWTQWELHIQLPPSHPLAGNELAKDHILAMLQAVYTAPEPGARDIQALTDLVSVAIPVETFILFTAVTLQEKEMACHTPTSSPPIYGSRILPLLTPGATACHCFLVPCIFRVYKREMNP
jgi:hypothetical protein